MSSKEVDFKKKTNEIFKLLNEYRRNPKIFAKHLDNLKKFLDKNNVLSEPGKIPIQMVEGEEVINEAIKFLSSIKSLAPLELDPYLCMSAQEHVDDIGPKGMLSYQSSDGTEPEDRISKFGTYVDSLGENIDFGPNDAIGVIVSLTLDDGEEDRPHRDNLFKSDYKKIGIACGSHKTEYQMCVMDFAFDFQPHEVKSNKYVPDSVSQNSKANSSYSQYNQNNSVLNSQKQEIKPAGSNPFQQIIIQSKAKE